MDYSTLSIAMSNKNRRKANLSYVRIGRCPTKIRAYWEQNQSAIIKKIVVTLQKCAKSQHVMSGRSLEISEVPG